jgi:hydrocephalus-inducing protein
MSEFNTTAVLPGIDSSELQTPSQYSTQRLQSTAGHAATQRKPSSPTKAPRIIEFMDISELSNHKTALLDVDTPLFRPTPSEVLFQRFGAAEAQSVAIALRNVDSVPRRLKLLQSESPYFEIVAPENAGAKVAPGMELTYKVVFQPNGVRDYADEIVCLTEREKFVIPIRAVGSRGVLDFPDKLHFPTCPVKHPTSKVILVRNLGDGPASFSLACDNDAFALSPSTASLDPGTTMQVEAVFTPRCSGAHTGRALCTYATGEVVAVDLEGSAEDSNVRLEKSSLRLETTFIKHASQRVVRLQNRSEHVVKFCWKTAATEEEEQQYRSRKSMELHALEAEDQDEFAQMLSNDPVHRSQMSILTRNFESKRHAVANDPLNYDDDVISIEPSSGELWPNSDIDVTVVFTPHESTAYSRTVFCDVSGREHRLPLKLNGEGMGPTVEIPTGSMDLGSLFVGSTHVYEVVCTNAGNIDAPFAVAVPDTKFARNFTISPSEGVIKPGEHQVLRVVFRSDQLGAFDEEFTLNVTGCSPNQLPSTRFSGQVIPPTFRMAKEEFDFGTIAYNFPVKRGNTLLNTSLVPLEYRLRLPAEFKEAEDFLLEPSTGTLAPGAEAEIFLNLHPQIVGFYDLFVLVDVVGVAEGLLTVPISATCVAPQVTLEIVKVDFGRCFLGLEYIATVRLTNTTGLPGCYELDALDDGSGMSISSPEATGTVAADSVAEVTIAMTADKLGELTRMISFRILGDESGPLDLRCGCIGEGAVVSVHPGDLKWGKQQVLVDAPKELTVTNESRISAAFSCSFLGGDGSVFSCSPMAGQLEPGASVKLTVIANLNNTSPFTDTLFVAVEKGRQIEVPLKGRGVGSVLVAEPALELLDFGNQYSQVECSRAIKLTNGGTRGLRVVFSLDSPAAGVSGECTVMRGSTYVKKRTPACLSPPDPSRSQFGVYPETVELGPGEECTVEVRGLTDGPVEVDEVLLCHGLYDDDANKRLLRTSRIKGNFVKPTVQASPRALHFVCERRTETLPEPQTQSVTVQNHTSLDVTATISCEGPFAAHQMGGTEFASDKLVIPASGSVDVVVRYDPMFMQSVISRRDAGTLRLSYDEHPQVDVIPLSTVVSFPNLALSKEQVDFGSIVMERATTRTITMTNPSPMESRFEWFFESDDANVQSIEQIFDIMPSSGVVAPGASQEVVFHYQAHSLGGSRVIAVCEVDHGPTYEVALDARSAFEQASCDQQQIEFGAIDYRAKASKTFTMVNECSLDLPFNISVDATVQAWRSPSSMQKEGRFETDITSGTLKGNTSIPITVLFTPQIPREAQSVVKVCIGNLPPILVRVTGDACYPSIRLHGVPTKEAYAGSDGAAQVEQAEGVTKVTSMIRKRTDSPEADAIVASIDEGKRPLVLQEYVLDFGAVKRESVVTKKLTICNNSSQAPVSLKINKKKLEAGYFKKFAVNTDEINGLAVQDTCDIRVTFCSKSTTRTKFPLGVCQSTLILQIANGGQVRVIVKADITQPEILTAPASLDFGSIICGECNLMYMQVVNVSSVPCTWSMKPNLKKSDNHSRKVLASASRLKRVAGGYEVTPSTFELAPQQRITVAVRFVPTEQMKYDFGMPMLVDGVAEPDPYALTGRGMEPTLEFGSAIINMGPLLPYGNSADAMFTVTNKSSVDVEFFSLEYDKQYLKEEEILRLVDTYDSKRRICLPPRPAGAPLPAEMLKWGTQMLAPPAAADMSDTAEVAAEAETAAEADRESALHKRASSSKRPPSSGKDSRTAQAIMAAAAAARFDADEAERAAAEAVAVAAADALMTQDPVAASIDHHLGNDVKRAKYRLDHGGFNAIVYGRIHSGQSTQAAKLARSYGSVLLVLDDIIEGALKGDTLCGKRAFEFLQEAEATGVPDTESPTPKGENSESAAAEEDASGSPTPEVEGDAKETLPPATHLPTNMLGSILRERIMQDDALDGVVIDGLACKYASPLDGLEAVLKVLGTRDNVVFVQLDISAAESAERLNKTEAAARATRDQEMRRLELSLPPNMSELQFERLSASEREAFANDVFQYKSSLNEKLAAKADEIERVEREAAEAAEATKGKKGKHQQQQGKHQSKLRDTGPIDVNRNLVKRMPSSVSNMLQTMRSMVEVVDAAKAAVTAPEEEEAVQPDPFETHFEGVCQLLEYWDRSVAKPAPGYAVQEAAESDARGKPKKPVAKAQKDQPSEDTEEEVITHPLAENTIPKIDLPAVGTPESITDALVDNVAVPRPEDVARTLVLNRGGDSTVLPPSRKLSVVPYPAERATPFASESFLFHDPSIVAKAAEEAAAKDAQEKAAAADTLSTSTGGKSSKKSSRPDSRSGKKETRKSSSKGRKGSGGKSRVASPTPDLASPVAAINDVMESPRWTVPANGQIDVHLRYLPKIIGTQDMTFNFESVQNHKQYSVSVRGTCAYPELDRSPTVMFPKVVKQPSTTKILRGVFVESISTFDFGPLLVGRSRDNLKSEPNKGNCVHIKLKNVSGQVAEISAGLETDLGFDCFTLDPFKSTIPAGGEEVMRLWAYPRDATPRTDRLFLCIQNNPEPVVIDLKVEGVAHSLEFESKTVAFDRVLLHRKDTQILKMTNTTRLPVAFRVVGVEALGDGFSVGQLEGKVPAKSDFHLPIYFKASKAHSIRKPIRIEYGDTDTGPSGAGMTGSESIMVTAESYDVMLALTFPKNSEHCLDYEMMRVNEDKHLTCELKNKGKYELEYKFSVVDSGGFKQQLKGDLKKMLSFEIIPAVGEVEGRDPTVLAGTVAPSDKAAKIKFNFRTEAEISITELPLVRCEITDPFMKEIIAVIPIHVTARSVFSTYTVTPMRGINFGPREYPSITGKATREFVIENTGELEFRYNITKFMKHTANAIGFGSGRGSTLGLAAKSNRRSSSTPNAGRLDTGTKQSSLPKFTAGCFAVSSGGGVIAPGTSTKVTVDADPTERGLDEQILIIDVIGREPSMFRNGQEYTLGINACSPAIETADVRSIFAEHAIVTNPAPEVLEPTFIISENRFNFGHVQLGESSVAKIRVANTSKIPCDVLVSCGATVVNAKAAPNKSSPFTVVPSKLSIPSHDSVVVTVTFTPTTCSPFDTIFDASIEKAGLTDSRTKQLRFDITGHGALPRVSVLEPMNKRVDGTHLLQFRRTRVGALRTLPVKVTNNGTIPARVLLQIVLPGEGDRPPPSRSGGRPGSSKSRASSAKKKGGRGTTPAPDKNALLRRKSTADGSSSPDALPFETTEELGGTDGTFVCSESDLPVTIACGETRELSVTYTAHSKGIHNARLRVCVVDNIFEGLYIEATGEGHEDDIALELPGGDSHLAFPDTPLNKSSTVDFMMVNSAAMPYRYEFVEHSDVAFEPRIGFVAPNSTRKIEGIFAPSKTCAHTKLELGCNIEQITDIDEEHFGWDTSQKVVRWHVTEGIDGRLNRQKIESTVVEPEATRSDKRTMFVTAAAISDVAKYTLLGEDGSAMDLKSPHAANFLETMMYQRRTAKFTIRNDGKVRFPFNFHITDDAMELTDEYMPFEVSPMTGVVLVGDSVDILVSFAPMEVRQSEALLTCSIGGQSSTSHPLRMDLSGSSQRPLCHFDLPLSDYLKGDRHHLKGQSGDEGQIDPNTKVLEIEAHGLKRPRVSTFCVVNPTDSDYKFKWIQLNTGTTSSYSDSLAEDFGPFRCFTQSGTIKSGTKCEMRFEYTPTALEVQESFWNFSIKGHDVLVPFLMVGRAKEAGVTFDRHSLNLVPLLVGQKYCEKLVLSNSEDTPHSFKFSQSSLRDINQAASMVVHPRAGVVPANSVQVVNFTFSPKIVQPYNFQLQCNIENRFNPDIITVRCNAHAINAALSCENTAGILVPLSSGTPSVMDFGTVAAFDSASRTFHLRNNGEYPLEFNWADESKRPCANLLVEPVSGVLVAGATTQCTLTFKPSTSRGISLVDVPLVCKIVNGPVYGLLVSGEGRLPQLKWSFQDYNFGKAFMHRPGMPCQSVKLAVTNMDSEQIMLESLFENTDAVRVKFESQTIQPAATVTALIEFTPIEPTAYKEKLSFLINSRTTIDIAVHGVGVPLKLGLADLSNSTIKFGAVMPGKTVQRTINMRNDSRLPITFSLTKDTRTCDAHGLAFTPNPADPSKTGLITLPPQSMCPVQIVFQPPTRLVSFAVELSLECLGIISKLLLVTGSCPGVKVELDADQVTFGPTVLNSITTRRLMLTNSGDAGAKFRWDHEPALAEWFSITPKHGYLSAGLDVPVRVAFHPKAIPGDAKEIRFEGVKCHIEGLDKPLQLDLAGTPTQHQAEREGISFHATVRTADTKQVKIDNKTKETWVINPSIDHPYFTVAESTATVAPGSSKLIDVQYKPLRMTGSQSGKSKEETASHNASLFIALPDGQALVYLLTGKSTAPKPLATIEREVPCKVTYVEPLPVTNWLQKPQRFRVEIKRDSKGEQSTVLRGVTGEYIDVPAGATRDYKLEFYAFKEGIIGAEIIIRNEKTLEFMVYKVHFKATPPGVLDTIRLQATVRTKAVYNIQLNNPLTSTPNLTLSCQYKDSPGGTHGVGSSKPNACTEISAPKNVRATQGRGYFIEFLPLFEGERSARLTLSSPDLGSFHYDLVLCALPAAALEQQDFTAVLGQRSTRKLSFTNYAPSRTDYTIAIEGEGFIGPAQSHFSATANPEIPVTFEMSFEPCQLGTSRAMVTVTSKLGGKYLIPVVGECLPPEPLGPFVVRANHSVRVAFKNTQSETTKYVFSLDNPAFSVKPEEELKAKETKDIVIKYDQNSDAVVRTARLLVTCMAGPCKGTTFVFYIKGVPTKDQGAQ